MITISVDPSGETVSLNLTAYLGYERFSKFRDICQEVGARYFPASKVTKLAVIALPILLESLKHSGIPLKIDKTVSDMLAVNEHKANESIGLGKDRLSKSLDLLKGSVDRLKPYRFQEVGVEWIAAKDRAMLLDEMGLGKTAQVLMAIGDRDKDRTVVVCPIGVANNWIREIGRWRPDLLATKVDRAGFRWPQVGEIIVVGYSSLPGFKEELPLAPENLILIADEAHYIKNRKAQRSKGFVAIRDAVKYAGGKVWGITGTPLLNRPSELWSLLCTFELGEQSFGNWYGFVGAFNGIKSKYGYTWGRLQGNSEDEIAVRLRRVALRRRRAEVLKDLPEKLRVDRTVEVIGRNGNGAANAVDLSAADKVLEALRINGVDISQVAELTELTKHEFVFEQMSAARAALATAKIPAMLEVVAEYEDTETPLVVFSAHRAPIKALEGREGWGIILGDTTAEARTKLVDDFQEGRLMGLAGSIKAMGVGITLHRASHLLFVDLDWTPANNSQAEDRLVRIGQTADSVLVTRLVAEHALDQRVLELITEKQRYIDEVDKAAVGEEFEIRSIVKEEAVLASAASQMAKEMVANEEAKRIEDGLAKVKSDIELRKAVIERITTAGVAFDGREKMAISEFGQARGPANAMEDWTASALVRLAGDDPDHAKYQNSLGFDRYDGDFGHSLAKQISERGMLTDRQWVASGKLVKKYRRQVGEFNSEASGKTV